MGKLFLIIAALFFVTYAFSVFPRPSSTTVSSCAPYKDAISCVKDIKCKPTYDVNGPPADSVGMPVVNTRFRSCVDRPQAEVDILVKNKTICEEQKATWLDVMCSCPAELFPDRDADSSVVFIKDKGCMTSKQICEDKGGIWTKPKLSTELYYCAVNGIKTDVGERTDSVLVEL